MKSRKSTIFALAMMLSALVSGCASTNETPTEPAIQPKHVLANSEPLKYKAAQWGGSIIAVSNFQDHTDIEVVAYPLKKNGLPDTSSQPIGRFIARKKSFLEPANFPPGRLLTIDGSVLGTQAGKVGEANYTYPVLLAHDLKLWAPQDSAGGSVRPNVHFGFGIGSGGRSGVGIGIGF